MQRNEIYTKYIDDTHTYIHNPFRLVIIAPHQRPKKDVRKSQVLGSGNDISSPLEGIKIKWKRPVLPSMILERKQNSNRVDDLTDDDDGYCMGLRCRWDDIERWLSERWIKFETDKQARNETNIDTRVLSKRWNSTSENPSICVVSLECCA